MLGFLNGVPGKLTTLISRLTAARAGYLDNLSAGAVAQAATAVSNANYTATRAGYLDKLNIAGNVASDAEPMIDTAIASGLVAATTAQLQGLITTNVAGLNQSTTATTGADVDVVSYTGAGVLEFAALSQSATTITAATLSIIADGVTIYTNTMAGAAANPTMVGVGAAFLIPYWNGSAIAYSIGVSLGAVPFRSSLILRYNLTGTAPSGRLTYKFRKTA